MKMLNSFIKILFFVVIFYYSNLVGAWAETITIGEGETLSTASTASGDNIILNYSDSILNADVINDTSSVVLTTISASSDGFGTINIDNAMEIRGDTGSSAKRINQINFADYSYLQTYGNVYVVNGFNVGSSAGVNLETFGDNSKIKSSLGTSQSSKLEGITVSANNIKFYGNLFTQDFVINANSGAVIEDSVTSANTDIAIIGTNSSLTLNSNFNILTNSLTNYANSNITIAADKQLIGTVDGNNYSLNFNSSLNLAIARSNSTTPLITSDGNVNVDSLSSGSLNLDFDYSNATYLKQGDIYNFLTAGGTLNTNSTTFNITDNSILLVPSVIQSGNNLQVTTSIDSATTTQLSAKNLVAANFLINATTTNVDAARTALFRISTQSALEDALQNMYPQNNNMLQKTSADIAFAEENIIEHRLQDINYRQFDAFYGFVAQLTQTESNSPNPFFTLDKLDKILAFQG